MKTIQWIDDLDKYVKVTNFRYDEVKNDCRFDLDIKFDDDVCINFNMNKNKIHERYIDPILDEHNAKSYHGTVTVFSKHNITAKNIMNLPYLECEKDIVADCLYVSGLTAKNVKANEIECYKLCACCVNSEVVKANWVYANELKGSKFDIENLKLPCGDWAKHIVL